MSDFQIAESAHHFEDFRSLTMRYVEWMKEVYADFIPLVEQYYESLQSEFDNLPGPYAPPGGCLLLLYKHGRAVGTVAFRPIDAANCEMKRMFVDTEMHGTGLGKALALEIIRRARDAGYVCMKLETGIRQTSAQRLYERLGFSDIEPYYPVIEAARPLSRYMELRL